MANGLTIKDMVKANKQTMMVIHMMVFGNMTNMTEKEKELKFGWENKLLISISISINLLKKQGLKVYLLMA